MIAQDLLELLRARPFVPFRIYASDGRKYEVRHPDQALGAADPCDPAAGGVPEGSEHLALAHIVRIEEMAEGSLPQGAN